MNINNCNNWLNPREEFLTLIDILAYRARHQPQQIAYTFLVDGETTKLSLTYQELEQKARAIATQLQCVSSLGERALLLYPPGLDFITAFLGCLYAGIIATPAYPPRRNMNLLRLQSIIQDAKATLVLTTSSLLNLWEKNQELFNMRCLSTDDIDIQLNLDDRKLTITPDQVALLQYTSGSTGTPKGVIITHRNLIANQQAIKIGLGHTEKTIFVGWLPLFHDMGLIGNVLQPLYLGIPAILMSPVAFLQKPLRWLQAISTYQATTSGGPNFAYDLCVSKISQEDVLSLDLNSWEVAFNGSEPIRPITLKRFAEHFAPCGFRQEAFYPCYGMAEATLFICGGNKTTLPLICHVETASLEENRVVTTQAEQNKKSIVSCGHPYLDEKIIIVDPHSLTQCSNHKIGEIWVSGSSIAAGYWQKPEQTIETFQAYLSDTGAGPFLRTGDLGFWQDGQLFITGRLKDIIIIRGQNHYPHDIELTVQNSDPALRMNSGAAFTVEHDNQSELIIVQEIDRTALRTLNIKEVMRNITEAVIVNHGLRPHTIVLLKPGSIPKTSSGKIQRSACCRQFLDDNLNVLNN